MPFTFSHPAFAAPLKAVMPQLFSMTGLVLGSMSPDFEYFLRFEPYRSIGHTTAGLFLQAIPLCIIFAWAFHHLIKEPLASHLPSWLRLDARANAMMVHAWKLRGLKDWIVFLYSVVIGFYLHIFVDEWTHISGSFVMRYSVMRELIADMSLYKWLQYGLSIVGLLAEIAVIAWLLMRTPPERTYVSRSSGQKSFYWAIIAAIAAASVLIKIVASGGPTLGMLIVAPISGLLLGFAVAGGWTKIKERHITS